MKYFPFVFLAIAVGFTGLTVFQAITRDDPRDEEEKTFGPSKYVLDIEKNGLFPQSLVYEVSGGRLEGGYVDAESGDCFLEYLYSVKVGEGELKAETLLGNLRERIDAASEADIDWSKSKDTVAVGNYEKGGMQGIIRAAASQLSEQEVEFYFLVKEMPSETELEKQ